MLDLAFVLLIIFVIATPLLEQGMKLELPEEVRRMRRLSAMMYVRWKSVVIANIYWIANR